MAAGCDWGILEIRLTAIGYHEPDATILEAAVPTTRSIVALLVAAAALGCRNDQPTPLEPDAASALATTAPAFVSLTGGDYSQTCGVASDGRLYCWGDNSEGELGDGTTTRRLLPTPIGGTLRFTQASAGYGFTCAVAVGGAAWCWGKDDWGQLGDGTTAIRRRMPTRVLGGLAFREVTTGLTHACGVGTDDRAYCWGATTGSLGDGTTMVSYTPVAVKGGLRFRHLEAGWQYTCGVTTDDRAYCWGANGEGSLGDSTTTTRVLPTPVSGGRRYRTITVGDTHTCAITPSDKAFCWGGNRFGEVGDGSSISRKYPRAVAGDLAFRSISAGNAHTCAITPANLAYCWGSNEQFGALGTGDRIERHKPGAVAGGHLFDQIALGLGHTCARTPTGRGYCWGNNASGEVGDGTRVPRLTPKAVAAPAP